MQLFRYIVPNFANIAIPLTNSTQEGSGAHNRDEKCVTEFGRLKTAITQAPILISPDWCKIFREHMTTSQYTVRGILTQLDEKEKKKVNAFSSIKLSPADRNCAANDRDLLALIRVLVRFRHYLEGSHFEFTTDNQVL